MSAAHLDAELEDPMLEIGQKIGRWTWILFLTLSVSAIATLGLVLAPAPALAMVAAIVGMVAAISGLLWLGFGSLWIWWRAFAPRRKTDVFYLRSFRNDADTWPIRVAIQQVLGQRRLSGIRDPRRREVSVLENYSPLFLAMKYCTPRYMDLEAGKDWKARLWHSLQRGQLAVLDLSVETPFVLEEVRLAAAALGKDRIICLGRSPQTADEIRAIAARELGVAPAEGPPHAIIWPAESGQQANRQQVAAFRNDFHRMLQFADRAALPAPAPAAPFCGDLLPLSRRARKSETLFWRMLTLQVVLVLVQFLAGAAIGLSVEQPVLRNQLSMAASAPFFIVNLWLLIQNWLIYIYDVGIWVDRIKAGIALAMTAVLLSISGFLGLSQPSAESNRQVLLPALTAEELEADQLLLAAEDQAEGQGTTP